MQPNSEESFVATRISLPLAEGGAGTSNVIRREDIASISELGDKIQQTQLNFEKQKEEELLVLVEQERELSRERYKQFMADFEQESALLKQNLESYFADVEKHCFSIVKSTLSKINALLPDEEKTRSVLREVVEEFRGQEEVILFLPSECDLDRKAMGIPEAWVLKYEEGILPGNCKLALAFGEVHCCFEKSLDHLVDAINPV